MLEELFMRPALRRPQQKFLIAGAQYPADFPWSPNVYFVRHLPPHEHAAFMSSSRLTLNVTRAQMAALGWCPSGRLFEAAACGAAILSDEWPGLGEFYRPDSEILLAHTAEDTLAALDLDDATLRRIGRLARERTLEEHTSTHRARRLVGLLEDAYASALVSRLPLDARARASHGYGSCGA
jgi:spore maturation protein CgeB